MKEIFNFCPADIDQLTRWFKSRLDWHPYYPSCQSYAYNWASGLDTDKSHFRKNDRYHFHQWTFGDHISILSFPVEPLILPERIVSFIGMELVGLFAIDEGSFEVDMGLSLDPEIIESIWFLSSSRYNHDGETILPEFDALETNTPGYPNQMSISTILNYNPLKTFKVRKYDYAAFNGRHKYKTVITKSCIKLLIDNKPFYTTRRTNDSPLYPIIWSAVGDHQKGPNHVTQTEIYHLRLFI